MLAPLATAFDSAVKPALDRFKSVYSSLAKLPGVRFHASSPDTETA